MTVWPADVCGPRLRNPCPATLLGAVPRPLPPTASALGDRASSWRARWWRSRTCSSRMQRYTGLCCCVSRGGPWGRICSAASWRQDPPCCMSAEAPKLGTVSCSTMRLPSAPPEPQSHASRCRPALRPLPSAQRSRCTSGVLKRRRRRTARWGAWTWRSPCAAAWVRGRAAGRRSVRHVARCGVGGMATLQAAERLAWAGKRGRLAGKRLSALLRPTPRRLVPRRQASARGGRQRCGAAGHR